LSTKKIDLTKKIKKLPHVKKKNQPRKIYPQKATLVDQPPSGNDWLHEVKWDGYRIICIIKKTKITLFTRQCHDWTDTFPLIANALKNFPADEAILDGEIIALNEAGEMSFQALQNHLEHQTSTTLKYYIFDIPYCSNYDLTKTPLKERKDFLNSLFKLWKTSHPHIEYSDYIQGHGDIVFQQACQKGLEGIISKKISAAYEEKRTRTWVKSKCLNRQEFVIGGFTKPKGGREFFGALLLGYYDPLQQLIYCGRVGTGFDDTILRDVFRKLKKLIQKTSAFSNPPIGSEAEDVIWVKPKLVCEIKFFAWTEANILRQSVFLGLREDKSAKDVHKEEKSKMSADSITVSGVTITNADKLLYPQDRISKKNLADYYNQISEWILPHLKQRPLSLLRCPSGIDAECFFQKNFEEPASKHTKIITVQEKKGKTHYLSISNKAGLLTLVQLGVLEIHPWGCRDDLIEKPDRITFDLDPGPDVPWKTVLQGAVLVHEALEHIGLKSFVKTTGGKGLHIVLPIMRRLEWPEVKDFAKAFAIRMTQLYPKQFTATVTKSKRSGKIFIDYLRNGRGSTAVAAYSTRAREHATVSTPVHWDELMNVKSSSQFTIKNVPERLAKLKKDPWEGFFECRQGIRTDFPARGRG
jgi:bifunctional non-homologous end joining protein LigD